ncbi:MAG: PqqD family protein [Alphaproteobacteria bacterium]|nr:PqqD family protein [Alphaproteobacteria bacterium]
MTDAASCNPVMAPDLEINEVADGYIVYQADRDRVHYLNQTAALVFELCNGRNAEADMPELLRLAWDLSEAPFEEVADCLKALRKEGLIT